MQTPKKARRRIVADGEIVLQVEPRLDGAIALRFVAQNVQVEATMGRAEAREIVADLADAIAAVAHREGGTR